MSQGRRAILPTRPRRDPRASLVALVIQLVVVVVLARMVVFPAAMDLFGGLSDLIREQRVTYVVPAPVRAGTPGAAPRDGGDGRRASETPPERVVEPEPITAPVDVPSGLPTRPGRAAPIGPGSGPVIGGGGPLQGIQPGFTDPRLWPTPRPYDEPRPFPMNRADSLEAVLHAFGERFVDSVSRAAPTGRQPGDWTWERNGRKYGMDPQYIRLGKYSIPTALLALLPLNVPANGLEMERARRLSSMRSEIMEQAERRARDDDFYAAVRALRERKERERREAEAARRGSASPASATTTPRPPMP